MKTFADENEILFIATHTYSETVDDFLIYDEWIPEEYLKTPYYDGYKVDDISDVLHTAEEWQDVDMENRSLYYEIRDRNEFTDKHWIGKES